MSSFAPREGRILIALTGLPAMGKSTIAAKILQTLELEGVRTRVFNNGEVRRSMFAGQDTSSPDFYNPQNAQAAKQREQVALANLKLAREYLQSGGEVALYDATNSTTRRRRLILDSFPDIPVLFVRCVNNDPEILSASVSRKTRLPEFAGLSYAEAYTAFLKRIEYYRGIEEPLESEPNYLILDSLDNRIIEEKKTQSLPHFELLRDLLVSDWVKNLYLCRHGESFDNMEGLIGGNSELTLKGKAQSGALAAHFKDAVLPYIFTSTLIRTRQMAEPLAKEHPEALVIALPEFDEIKTGSCEGLTYSGVKLKFPAEHAARAADKFHYAYPGGESYAGLLTRVKKGLKKALYLSGNAGDIMIIGHQAVNRGILSHFLFRRAEDVPYVHIPQNRYFHLISTQRKKLVELKSY